MPVENKDLGFIWDMLVAARDIHSFIEGVSLEEFEENKLIRYAVERQLLVIGEAVNHISEPFKEQHPEIPWLILVGQRNVLAHQYGEILAERVWKTATADIPPLIESLEAILE